ncbi:glutamate racemase [Candidatus Azobacteroides pseudotrichonymphae]|uniref:Glutamate racemase n=1 Tax=Azobacteroides pseudotrichonymphae genomovar. CFP2 TaxID=511995 RepID=B6YRL6_AZOPC|nr:glutamate racemase [Candidatus Azobacteroides pseudotrichonymphae]BAG83838.1 glutamate racemase [Candidatus Azobacteroides pseudotrichonymphae genomovar. CFP2]
MKVKGSIGIFDSGYGGFTILEKIRYRLPRYDFLYLGDNARAPYGTRSFEIVYEFTLQSVRKLFEKGCHLVILACNTSSAKALRTIQQNDLPSIAPQKRLLGVIRPTVEAVGRLTQTRHIGVLGTQGTILSGSYSIEMKRLFPDIVVTGEACPMWVSLVENGEYDRPGADYFVKQHINSILNKDPLIDTLVLGCTHYPLLETKIKQYLPKSVSILSQGKYVAEGLADYLRRHPEIDMCCSKNSVECFYTTESENKFASMANIFFKKKKIDIHRISLG